MTDEQTVRPRIENSDRGITLNKSLAWTVASVLVGAGLWVGVQVATLTEGVQGLRRDMSAISQTQTEQGARIRSNETGIARQDERMALILSTLGRIDSRLERMERQRP